MVFMEMYIRVIGLLTTNVYVFFPMEHLGLATFTQPIKETILVVHVGGHVYVNSSLYVHSLKTNR